MRTSVLGMILAGGEGTRLAPLTDRAVLGLHLRGNRDDEAAADLGGRYVPAVDDVFHQTL